jgi:urease accessory protein
MINARSVRPVGSWTGAPADSVVLDYDERHRRRVTMKGARGLEFLLDLAEAVLLRSGDALALDDGRLVEVVAAPEPLAEIRAADAKALVRIAWHFGNRHLPTELTRRGLRIRRDPVIEEMARKLGAEIVEIEAPFNPEGGAYAAAGDDREAHDPAHHAHDHDHVGHDHQRHDHHAHDHHAHDHHTHDHGGHDHDHKHDHGRTHG